MQQVQVSRVDLLAATSDNRIFHLELQATNDPYMAVRMVEYGLRVYRNYGLFPKQIVLYVSDARMNMKPSLQLADSGNPALIFAYTLIGFRDLDGAVLLASHQLTDKLLSILAKQQD